MKRKRRGRFEVYKLRDMGILDNDMHGHQG